MSAENWTAALVVTTIYDGEFLDGYYAALSVEGLLDRVTVYVIPDRKTPEKLYERCAHFRSNRGLKVVCPTLPEQYDFLYRLGIGTLIPFDSDNRRNIGYLMALESGCDFLVSVDDDNFHIAGSDFFHEHAVVCQPPIQRPQVTTDCGWFNACSLLEMTRNDVWPRGAPYRHRTMQPTVCIAPESSPQVRLNAGLWVGEPDLDATTWLLTPAHSTTKLYRSVVLGDGTWSPVSTQNTALHRSLIPACYFIPMHTPGIDNFRIDRFGDVLGGYFCQCCMQAMGDHVRFGTPLVQHRRTKHDYQQDAAVEIYGVQLVEETCDWLRTLKLTGTTYSECYLSLADEVMELASKSTSRFWSADVRRYLERVTRSMRQWIDTCRRWI